MTKGGKRANSGRKRQPTAKLKAEGTYRADRHANRNAEAEGVPMMPEYLTGKWAVWLWELVEPQLIAWGAGESQAAMFASMCELFQDYRDARNVGDLKAAYQAHDRLKGMAAEFGLTLAAMAKMEVKDGSTKDKLEAEHFGVVG